MNIPTVRDRIIQAIVKNALEPEWEAKFEPSSYGFRPGRSTHDAVQDCWSVLNKAKKQWILDADIKGAFDNISHDFLLTTLKYFPAKPLIEKWLKAGVMIGLDLTPVDAGTPQGGIISPLLANIALHGMEEAIGIHRSEHKRPKFDKRIIRYADDFVALTETREAAETAKAKLTEWLKIRGLELSVEKTSIRHISEGFEFLGFEIKERKSIQARRNKAIHILPSQKGIKKFKAKVREILKRNLHSSPNRVLLELNPLIRGWGMYYRSGVSRKIFEKLDQYIWRRTWQYARRRHPNKNKRWRKQKYYTTVKGWQWCFYDEKTGVNVIHMKRIPIIRHVKVKGTASPDDPQLEEYWLLRQKKPKELTGKKAILWVRQKGICPVCEGWLDNDEELHLHHTRGRGTEALKYLQLLHETCHQQVTINGTA